MLTSCAPFWVKLSGSIVVVNSSMHSTSLPSIMLTLGSGSKVTFIEVLTVNNYKIIFCEQYTNRNIYKYKQL